MSFNPNYRGFLICLILVILFFPGLIGLVFDDNSYSLHKQQHTTTDAEIDSDLNQFVYPTDRDLERQTRASNVTFKPFPYIEGPALEEGEVYRVTPKEDFIDFKVYNKGNGEDNFEMTVQVGDTSYENELLLKKGWNAILHSGKYTKILKINESQIVTVKVIVPSLVPQGSPCPIKLTATSIKDPTHQDGSKNITFNVFTDLYEDVVFVNRELGPLYMFPDSEKGLLLEIRNVGNYIDSTIRVNVATLPDDWEVIIDSSDIPAGGLRINASADIEVTIRTPKQVLESTHNIKLSVMSNNEIKDEATIPVHILKMQNISIDCKRAQKMGDAGEIITFTIIVHNEGNIQETIDLSYSYLTRDMENMSWKIEFSENPVILSPYESYNVVLAIFIPPNALADINYLTPSRDGYLIRIRGISQNNTTITDEKELEILINPIFNFTFSKSKDIKYFILHQTQIVDYTFKIENKGNIQDIIEIWPDSDVPGNLQWISIPYDQRKLFPGVTEEPTIKFDPPPHLEAGRCVYTIYGKSLNVPSLVQSVELTIEIIESDLELSKIMIGNQELSETDVKVGDTVQISVLVRNIGNLDYNNETSEEKVVIRFMEGSNYLGEVDLAYLPSQISGDNNLIWVYYPWYVGRGRDYTINVILDPYDSFPEINNNNNELMGEVKVEPLSEEIVDKDKDDDVLKIPNLSTIVVMIFIFLLLFNIIIWLLIFRAKHSNKKK